MTEIEKIAGVHLGKAGDGSAVKPYVTPDDVDPSLLVAVPRSINRTAYGIGDAPPFVGFDTWNAYEFSTLLENGYPVTGWVRLSYSAYTHNIVESKSLKLYLNSFNMARLIKTLDNVEIMTKIIKRISDDLTACVGGRVNVRLRLNDAEPLWKPMTGTWIRLEELCNITETDFNSYTEDPALLKAVKVPGNHEATQKLTTNILRSNCRVTNQPDWGDIYIYIKGKNLIDPTSLLQYIVSFRKENHFHEEVCEMIYKRLFDLLQPAGLVVSCLYTRRGGIDINPVRATSHELMFEQAAVAHPEIFNEKTMRQ